MALGRQMNNKRSRIYPGPWGKAKVAICVCFHGITTIFNAQDGPLKGDEELAEKSPVPL